MQSDFQKMFRKIMEDKLAARPHIAEKCTSTTAFPFACQKLTLYCGALLFVVMRCMQ